jgi:hypothetical protein
MIVEGIFPAEEVSHSAENDSTEGTNRKSCAKRSQTGQERRRRIARWEKESGKEHG